MPFKIGSAVDGLEKCPRIWFGFPTKPITLDIQMNKKILKVRIEILIFS